MDDIAKHETFLGLQTSRRTSANVGLSQRLGTDVAQNPYNGRRRVTRSNGVRQEALKQGFIAVNSILRDWVKAQVTIIESGIVSFEAVFMPHMLTATGQTVLERITTEGNLLPAPEPPKVVQLPTAG